NLPPAFIDVSSTEIFRDEDIDYAQRIWQTGGVAELHVWPGGFHAFTVIEPNSKLSQHAIAASANWYRRLLAFTSSKKNGIEQPFFDTASHIIILFGNVAFNLIPLCSSASCRQAA
ncbi:unnamed protein product, partial [Rotaria magnacalcarata]